MVEESILKQKSRIQWLKLEEIPAIEPEVLKRGNVLTRNQQLKLIALVSKEHVFQALQRIDDSKAPGILQKYLSSDQYPVAPPSIRLYPKFITSRLQEVKDYLVDDCQSTFVPGRVISDNIILSNELVKGYNRKSTSPRYCMKIDIRKSYDSVEWCFLEQILMQLISVRYSSNGS
ncbi:PREDICTED: uncharacterized protein LOC109221140 [Nicotiana attenuata]|uniref:uncharacterized protein LOC109221140 n=1 Tax=Nicotiana attenuata TaxID=49451 RepID=UPI00090478ED|nr:PREDICTED: uncharacterized protein LOC109221140 [Nicotiana attenuata]